MGRLATAELEVVDELQLELVTIRLDDLRLDGLLSRLRQFLGLDSLIVVSFAERLTGWGLDRLETDNLPNPSRFGATLATFLARAPHRFWFFDPVAPEDDQRNCVIEPAKLVGDATYRASTLYRELLQPLHLEETQEVRVLVCEGATLLGYVGGFHHGAITEAHRTRLAALVPALKCRLAAERSLRRKDIDAATLGALIDQHDDAAFVIGPHGHLTAVNRAGRARLRRDREGVIAAISGTPGRADVVESVRLDGQGAGSTLVVLRKVAETDRCETRVQQAADRWRLTRRQREVLQLIIRGRGNASISEELGIGERAVELHVSAILDRACVHNRASLIALVFGALVGGGHAMV